MSPGAALALGLISSLHCAVMCAPLALVGTAGPACGASGRWLGYLGARLLAYTAMGAAMGALGRHALCVLPLAPFQAVAAGALALFAIVQGVKLVRARRGPAPIRLRARRAWTRAIADLLPRRGAALGVVTAILPCGASLAAYALASSTASPTRGALTTALFALASTPGVAAPLVTRLALGARTFATSPMVRACAWWAFAAYSLARPLLGAHHH